MIENIEQAKKHLKGIVDFYKLNDKNNYDYSDDVLKSMKILLDYITNLQKENKKVHKDFAELSERYFFTKSRNEKAREELKQKDNIIKELRKYINENEVCLIRNGIPEIKRSELLNILDKGSE